MWVGIQFLMKKLKCELQRILPHEDEVTQSSYRSSLCQHQHSRRTCITYFEDMGLSSWKIVFN